MAKLHSYHEGDRAEFLALFAFSTIGHCVQVERVADYFKVDVFVHLFKRVKNNLVFLGQAIAVQVKSNTDEIMYETEEELRCLYDLDIPLFFAVIDKENYRIAVYTTFLRYIAYWTDPKVPVVLRYGKRPANVPNSPKAHVIYVGDPVYQADLAALEGENKHKERENFLGVIRHWARWDFSHLQFKLSSLPFVACPAGFTTNEPFSTKFGDVDFMTFARLDLLQQADNSLAARMVAAQAYYNALVQSKPAADVTKMLNQRLAHVNPLVDLFNS